MANIATIGNRRLLIDVGYGPDGPCRPLQLVSGELKLHEGLPGQQLRLVYKSLTQHSDPGQRVWVYSQRRNDGDWEEVYHFPDVEFFGPDFDILNYYTVTKSYWTKVVLVHRFVFDDASRISGAHFLFRDELKSGAGTTKGMDLVEKFETESERIRALEDYFSVRLTASEKSAIRGSVDEIR